MPAAIQARVLLTGLRHLIRQEINGTESPHATPAEPENINRNNAALAKKLLSAGGVVAVKLAQMLAEDPKIPRVSCLPCCLSVLCGQRQHPTALPAAALVLRYYVGGPQLNRTVPRTNTNV